MAVWSCELGIEYHNGVARRMFNAGYGRIVGIDEKTLIAHYKGYAGAVEGVDKKAAYLFAEYCRQYHERVR